MDLKYALRSLLKNPGFTALAVIVMALGIGANTAVFSVVNAVLLRPLAYKNPERIVTVANLWKKTGRIGRTSSAPDFHDWHDQSTAFDAMADYASWSTSVIAGNGVAEYAEAAQVSPEFFRVFGAEPVAGRLFTPEEWKNGGAGVIGQAYAQNHFGGNANALGKTLRIYGRAYTIVGVLPPGFDFPNKAQIWLTPDSDAKENRSANNFRVVGLLKPGVGIQQAQAQMTSIGDRLSQAYPSSNGERNIAVTGMRDRLVRDVRTTLYLLLGAVGVVLLISCANMANLLLARATSRTREIAIRAAVGAGRGRIIRQLITESIVLAMVAGVAGLILATWGSNALVAMAPSNVPRLAEVGIDGWVLAFTLAISVIASLLFGLAPALTASRIDLNDALKLGGAKAVVGGGAGKLRNAIVVAEIAFSVVLLIGAGLLMKSFFALNSVALGYRTDHLLLMEADVPYTTLEDARKATQFYKDLIKDLAQVPGVNAVGAAGVPPGRTASNGGYFIDTKPEHAAVDLDRQADYSVVAPQTFSTLGVPLLKGRDFDDRDRFDASPTAIVNETMAKKAFPGRDPLGHTIFGSQDSLVGMTIVGVVGDMHNSGPAMPPAPEIFVPYEQHPRASAASTVIVRTSADPQLLSEVLRRKVRDRSTEVPVKISTMEATLAEDVAAPRFRTLLFVIFAGLAICLAMAGVYGVMAYVVGQRLNEIGLRMALGASPGDVLGMVLKQGLALAGAGVALGLAGAIAATRLLTSFLFEVKPGDPLTYAGVAILLGVVAMAATYLPARRATKVDPLVALRQE
jgi:putative ABC transport system permease protein